MEEINYQSECLTIAETRTQTPIIKIVNKSKDCLAIRPPIPPAEIIKNKSAKKVLSTFPINNLLNSPLNNLPLKKH